jgi:hypothetical protein
MVTIYTPCSKSAILLVQELGIPRSRSQKEPYRREDWRERKDAGGTLLPEAEVSAQASWQKGLRGIEWCAYFGSGATNYGKTS